jgi:hypothetical protein
MAYVRRWKRPLIEEARYLRDQLMIIFAVNEGAGEIGQDIAERVVSLLRWQKEIRGEYDPVGSENAVARLEEQIRRILKRQNRTSRELRQYANADRVGVYLYNAARENLLKDGQIKYDRKRDLWYVPA